MLIRAEQLERHVSGRLLPVYVVAGEDPLLVAEAQDALRGAARSQGFTQRQIQFVERSFDAGMFHEASAGMSLFAENEVLEVRFGSKTPDKAASAAIVEYCTTPPEDKLLLLTCGAVAKNDLKKAWLKAVDDVGGIIQLWPIRSEEFPAWVRRRVDAAGLRFSDDALRLFVERTEGNTLACMQQIAHVKLLQDLDQDLKSQATAAGAVQQSQAWDVSALEAVLADSARADAFVVIDAAFAGDAQRTLRLLQHLRAEGLAVLAVLGALSAQLRRALPIDPHHNGPQALKRFGLFGARAASMSRFVKRKSTTMISGALARCAQVDQVAKGQGTFANLGVSPGGSTGQDWLLLERLLLDLAQ